MKTYNHLVKGLDPAANAFAGTVTSDIVSMKSNNHVQFIIYKGVGTTGTSTVTVEASSTNAAGATTAIIFNYQIITSGDTHGAVTEATTSGFVTTAGSSQLYKIDVDASALAASGYEYIRLKCIESVADPVLGGILIVLTEPSQDEAVQATTIV